MALSEKKDGPAKSGATPKRARSRAKAAPATSRASSTAKSTPVRTRKGSSTRPVAEPRTATTERAAVDTRSSVSAEERRRMIQEAAYLRAERRGFRGGSAEQDWFQAEAEVDYLLMRLRPRTE